MVVLALLGSACIPSSGNDSSSGEPIVSETPSLHSESAPGPESPAVDPATLLTRAILLDGPLEGRGIDELSPDLTPFWRGTYLLGEAQVRVRLVDGQLAVPATWQLEQCAVGLRSEGGLYYHENAAGWSILVSVANALPAAIGPCEFTATFATSFQLFSNLETLGSDSPPAFPGILEF